MNKEWQRFIDERLSDGQSDAQTAKNSQVSAEHLADLTIVSFMPEETVLMVSGDDAESFLQGQFSNDVAALAQADSQLTTWSTPKGRVLALFRLIRRKEDFLIRLPAPLADGFVRRLRMFVLRSKVLIEPLERYVTFGLAGVDAREKIKDMVGMYPAGVDQCVVDDDVVVVAVRGDSNRFEVTAPVVNAIEFCQALAGRAKSCGEAVWRLHNIQAGIPVVEEATSEAFVLQMLNLQHIDGVSFKKGCFPGQEVVARMQYLGKLKRRMYLLQGQSSAGVPVAGDELFAQGKSSAVGKVVDAQPLADGSYRMLAVCAIEAMRQTIYQDVDANHAIQQLHLPYSVDSTH